VAEMEAGVGQCSFWLMVRAEAVEEKKVLTYCD